MPVVRSVVAPSTKRGVNRAAPLIVLALLALAAGGVAWKLTRPGADAGPVQATTPTRPLSPATGGAPTENEAIDALLVRARGLVAVQHLLAPAGNNAFELYLAVRQREPDNAAATAALREVFPYAAEQAATTIRNGELAEARRQLELLARADPGNYTLTLLRSQLAAAADPAPAPGRASARSYPAAAALASAPPPLAAAAPPATVTPSPATASPVVTAVAARPPTYAPAPPSPPTPPRSAPTAAPVAATTAPVLVRRIEPYYPLDARRTRREGWVEVGFTVTAGGDVANVSVLAAEPRIVFDHAATSAVARWMFKPATRGGTPVAIRLKQRLDFRL